MTISCRCDGAAWLQIAIAFLVGGCASAPYAGDPGEPAARIIIQFIPAVTDPQASGFLRDLSRRLSAKIAYVRPISTGAHVFVVAPVKGDDELRRILQLLMQSPEVVYAEPDRRVKPWNKE